MNRKEFDRSQADYLVTGFPGLCERASEECSPSRVATKYWSQVTKQAGAIRADLLFGASASASPEEEEIYLYCDFHAPKNALVLNPVGVEIAGPPGQKSMSTLAKLRSQLSGHFGIRLQSTGDKASASTVRIIMQTLDVSPENPCVVMFEQFILEPFTGDGQFDLVENDSSDVDGKESIESGGVTIATKSGFADGVTTGGHSHFEKPITSDKVYSVVFVPGSAGDGIFSMSARTLYPGFIDPQPPISENQ